jgi:hypothetical protein
MNMNDNDNTQWGIVELMGRKVVAGRISKSEEFGTVLLRVDVPATSAFPEFTQMYGNSAIYCVTFTSEEVARRTAESTKLDPVSVYVPDLITREKLDEVVQRYEKRLEQLRALPSGQPSRVGRGEEDEPEDWDDDEDDDDR